MGYPLKPGFSTYILLACHYYRTAGFLREDFNHANGLIREIKIRVVFSALHFVSRLQ